jgi:TPR repeat protein
MILLLLTLFAAAPTPSDLDKACVAGNAGACFALGEDYKYGRNIRRDLKRAADLYRRSCQLKNQDGCAEDALGVALGRGQVADPVPAMARLEALCKAGQQLACANLGSLYLSGFGKELDRMQWPALLTTACDRGVFAACRTMASYRATNGDADGASQLADRACANGDPESCVLLGALFDRSDDVLRAGIAYAQACSAGSSAGCYGQGLLLVKTGGDRKRGKALLEKSCGYGETRACAALKDPKL